MKLKKILKNIEDVEIKGLKDIEITGICSDSKLVAPGNLFIAKKGKVFDGSHFIPEAIAAGAACILTDIYNPFFHKTTQLISDKITDIADSIAATYYGFASKELFMVGITGTNGKTTSAYLIKHILDVFGKNAGLIGTNEYILGDHKLPASFTTPDVITCQKLLREMKNRECLSCVMEVSSHGLDQMRVSHIDYDVAIFTNISSEHLDYHSTIDEYAECKSRLFSLLEKSAKKNTLAILNIDNNFSSIMQATYSGRVLTYGIDQKADVMAADIEMSASGSSFTVQYLDQRHKFQTSLIGKFNIYNLLTAVTFGISLDIALEELSDMFTSFSMVSGRLEKIDEYKKAQVFVDYAHTEDALTNVLKTLSEIKKGKIFTVFGCGGSRDKLKRSKMAQVAQSYSDFVIVTNDNPRSEDPEAICRDVLRGFSDKDKYYVELDRKEAIEKALSLASKEDIVLIAGKGHEKVQIFSHKTVPFDDRLVVCNMR